jgi:Ca2+-binding EF-hand superfamily protein
MKKYDRGSTSGASAGDNKLSRDEFAIDPKAFARADADADGAIDTEELRRHLSRITPDLELGVNLPARPGGESTIAVAGSGGIAGTLPPGVKVKHLGRGDVEIAVDEVRLEIHVEDGDRDAANAKRGFMAQFEAADKNNDGYLEKKELTEDRAHPSPLAGLFDLLDRDGDGKLYPKEMDAFVDAQAEAARSRLVLSASDQGRAIFAILDLNRDRRLGLRELRGTLDRVASWDRDGDGKITAEEIPHHYQLTLSRGSLSGLGAGQAAVIATSMGPPPPVAAGAGPGWFLKMDRNGDGDVSRREFLGSRAQFDRLDRDKDALLDASEASAATVAKKEKAAAVAPQER